MPIQDDVDLRRARELYSYLQPEHLVYKSLQRRSSSRFSARSSSAELNNALQPYAQLAAVRTDVQRALIIVVDRDHQYYLAEASRMSTQASTQSAFEEDEDLLWAGCSGDSKRGQLCEITVGLPSVASEPAPFFVVDDLLKDPRFSDFPIVNGPPNFRFYAGTPITTQSGTNIGTLCMFDTKPRPGGLTEEQQKSVSWIADQVMSHLEITREAVEGRRVKRMFDGLNHFVEGKPSMEDVDEFPTSQSQTAFNEDFPTKLGVSAPTDDRQPQRSNPTPSGDGVLESQGEKNVSVEANGVSQHVPLEEELKSSQKHRDMLDKDDIADSGSFSRTYARAANLLREALDLGESGGVLFVGAGNTLTQHSGRSMSFKPRNSTQSSNENDSESFESPPAPQINQAGSSTSINHSFSALNETPDTPTPVLGSSTPAQPYGTTSDLIDHTDFGQLDQEALWSLAKRYPKGKLWMMDENGVVYTSEEERRYETIYGSRAYRDRVGSAQSLSWVRHERTLLNALLPGVRQVLFAPLWDASNSRWSSACFCWTSSETRILSTNTELSFLCSFGRSVMAEFSRLDAVLSDRKKGDFIGSISHELRSPLHGILASVEFLIDTVTNPFQKTLVDTVDACGRTLLDTINHVLDYSKINSFERDWRNPDGTSSRPKHELDEFSAEAKVNEMPNDAPPLLRINGIIDVAAVTEEVVEAISIAQIYDPGTDVTDTFADHRISLGSKISQGKGHLGTVAEHGPISDPIEVILDIEGGDWVFMTQPGAIRRVIMNLFGNAIKFTSSGSIKVQLQQFESKHAAEDLKIMTLTVSDTGKGISPGFLSSELFTPFAQEDSLSPGTGLGLSLVRSITNMLGGTIEIRSQVGEGTIVQVSLPLKRPAHDSSETQSLSCLPRQSGKSTTFRRGSINEPLIEAEGCKTAIYCQREGSRQSRTCDSVNILGKYVTDWFGLELLAAENSAFADVVVLDERDLPRILAEVGLQSPPGLIVLCSNATKYNESRKDLSGNLKNAGVEYVSKPCGPYKLARALQVSFERLKDLSSGNVQPAQQNANLRAEGFKQDGVTAAVKELALNDSHYGNISTAILAENIAADSQANAYRLLQSEPMSLSMEPQSMDREVSANSSEPLPPGAEPSSSVKHESRPMSRSKAMLRSKSAAVSSLSLPLHDIQPPPALPSIGSLKPHDQRLPSPRLLLVDDNKINLRLLQTYMKKRNYDLVDSAENGQIAVNAVKAATAPYDIIFMDISMPVMNGFESTRAIRTHEGISRSMHRATIVALTGLANSRDQSEGLSAGCDIYMTKPVSFKELGKLLDDWRPTRTGGSQCNGA